MAKHEFLLPDVGEGLEAGTVVQWLAQPGDNVLVDQIIVEIETDKAIVEIPAPVTGILESVGGKVGESVPVGAVLACFDTQANESNSNAGPAAALSDTSSKPQQSQPSIPTSTKLQRVLASPATRKFARSQGVDLSQLSGSGKRGQITRADVDSWLSTDKRTTNTQNILHNDNAALMPAEARIEPLSGLRKKIAANMHAAWRDIPHVSSFEDIDATALVQARAELNAEFESAGIKFSFMPLFVKACVIALREHPRFNASLNMEDETVCYHGNCNIGIATATPQGLVVTVIHQAEQKSLVHIANEISELAALARERRVSVQQIQGGTFTVSNFGSYGSTIGTPIIRPPEVAIAGFGRIHEKVVPVNSEPAVRNILPLVVSTDHRLNDGEHLGGFMATLSRLLTNPIRLLGHQ